MHKDKKRLPDIFRTILFNAGIEKVWSAISTAEGLTAWLMPCTLRAELGNEFTLKSQPRGDWDGTIKCVVKELTPPNKIGFSWVGGGFDHYVSFTLMPTEKGTQLTLIHSGWYEGTEQIRETMYHGWGYLLDDLRDKTLKASDNSDE